MLCVDNLSTAIKKTPCRALKCVSLFFIQLRRFNHSYFAKKLDIKRKMCVFCFFKLNIHNCCMII